MKQKQHSTEEIIRILRQSDTDQTVDSSAGNRTYRKPPSTGGNLNTATWI